jgi:hypothetical protein
MPEKPWQARFAKKFGGTCSSEFAAVVQFFAAELAANDTEIAELKERLAHPNEIKCTRCGNWGRERHRIGPSTLCPDCASLFGKKLKAANEHS